MILLNKKYECVRLDYMGFTVSEIADGIAKNASDENSDEIKESWEKGISKGKTAIFFGMGESKRAQRKIEEETGLPYKSVSDVIADVRTQQALTEDVFDGDARAMIDFLVEYGGHPDIADMEFQDAVESGAISSLVQKLESDEPDVSDQPDKALPDHDTNNIDVDDKSGDLLDQSRVDLGADEIASLLSGGGRVYAMSSVGESFLDKHVAFSDLDIFTIDVNTGGVNTGAKPESSSFQSDELDSSLSSFSPKI